MSLLLRQVVRLFTRVSRTADDEKVKTLSLGPVYRSLFDVRVWRPPLDPGLSLSPRPQNTHSLAMFVAVTVCC